MIINKSISIAYLLDRNKVLNHLTDDQIRLNFPKNYKSRIDSVKPIRKNRVESKRHPITGNGIEGIHIEEDLREFTDTLESVLDIFSLTVPTVQLTAPEVVDIVDQETGLEVKLVGRDSTIIVESISDPEFYLLKQVADRLKYKIVDRRNI